MLFDLRSKGRRRAVRVIYLGLAILMGGGLVLFGVGSGNSGGGLLNGIGGSGSGSAQQQAVRAQEKAAVKAVKVAPGSANAWSQLVQARWSVASQNRDPRTGSFTASGQRELAALTTAYAQYRALTKTRDPGVSTLAAQAYVGLMQWPAAANAWEDVTISEGNAPRAFQCLALTASAAKQTGKASLASAKAISFVPKPKQFEATQQFKQFEKQPAAYAAANC